MKQLYALIIRNLFKSVIFSNFISLPMSGPLFESPWSSPDKLYLKIAVLKNKNLKPESQTIQFSNWTVQGNISGRLVENDRSLAKHDGHFHGSLDRHRSTSKWY